MQESASIALSYVRANPKLFKIDPEFFDDAFIHLHVPEGATPKDGPSAGITITTALVSLARGQEISRPLAMTGEITLTGKVLPVGGIKEKIIAARRSGIAEIILPEGWAVNLKNCPAISRKGSIFLLSKPIKKFTKRCLTKPDPLLSYIRARIRSHPASGIWAPITWQTSYPQAEASLPLFSMEKLLAMPKRKPAAHRSPAPVVSLTSLPDMALIRMVRLLKETTLPRFPSLTPRK